MTRSFAVGARAAVLVGAVLALAGCSMVPHYDRPAAAVPATLPQGASYPVLAGGDSAVDTIGWHDFMTDPRLVQVIARALDNNRDLRVTIANVAVARDQFRVTRANEMPTVTAVPGGGPVHGSISSGGYTSGYANTPPVTSTAYGVSAGVASFEIDLWGRKASLSKAAFETWLASDEGRKSAVITLVGDVASAWLTYAANADALAIARDTLKSDADTVAVTRQREEQGIGTALDVAQAETLHDGARADVANYTTALAQAKNALELLVGAEVEPALLPTTLDTGEQVRGDLPVGLDSAVLLSRPDVLQAEHALKSANANIGAAHAALFPVISLTGLAGVASGSLSGVFDSGALNWTATGTATQTLFDGGARASNLAAAKETRVAAVAAYQKAVQRAFADVADALARRGTINEQLSAQTALVRHAERAAEISQARYETGVATYLDALVAARTIYAARQRLVTVRLTRATNMVTLYRVLGGGLKP